MTKQPVAGYPSLNKSQDVLRCAWYDCSHTIPPALAISAGWRAIGYNGCLAWTCAKCRDRPPNGAMELRTAQQTQCIVSCSHPAGCNNKLANRDQQKHAYLLGWRQIGGKWACQAHWRPILVPDALGQYSHGWSR